MTTNLFLAGVGGQGTILTSRVLSEGLVRMGRDVKMSEIHGMAQRGGSVTTQIKFGEEVFSPIIGIAEADVLAAFEKAEAVRYLPYLRPGGVLLVNDLEIPPLPVLSGAETYPGGLRERLAESVSGVIFVDAFKIAAGLGNAKAQSVVMLGAVVKALRLESFDWRDVLKRFIPSRFFELNAAAFEAGLRS